MTGTVEYVVYGFIRNGLQYAVAAIDWEEARAILPTPTARQKKNAFVITNWWVSPEWDTVVEAPRTLAVRRAPGYGPWYLLLQSIAKDEKSLTNQDTAL